jgi:hypothetical protein
MNIGYDSRNCTKKFLKSVKLLYGGLSEVSSVRNRSFDWKAYIKRGGGVQ